MRPLFIVVSIALSGLLGWLIAHNNRPRRVLPRAVPDDVELLDDDEDWSVPELAHWKRSVN